MLTFILVFVAGWAFGWKHHSNYVKPAAQTVDKPWDYKG
jgi:hypothetical protein